MVGKILNTRELHFVRLESRLQPGLPYPSNTHYALVIKYIVRPKDARDARQDASEIDTGIAAAIALLFNQAFSGQPFDFRLALLGLGYSFSIWLMKRGGDRK